MTKKYIYHYSGRFRENNKIITIDGIFDTFIPVHDYNRYIEVKKAIIDFYSLPLEKVNLINFSLLDVFDVEDEEESNLNES